MKLTNIFTPESLSVRINNIMADDSSATTSWEGRVHPDLKSLLHKSLSLVKNFDTWWKVGIISTLMHIIPGPVSPGVKVTKVNGVGTLYHPNNTDESNNSSNKTTTILRYLHLQ